MGHAPLGATQGRAVIRHTPTDPWPDVRWDALALVGRLVFEVPEGWTATTIEDGTTGPGPRLALLVPGTGPSAGTAAATPSSCVR